MISMFGEFDNAGFTYSGGNEGIAENQDHVMSAAFESITVHSVDDLCRFMKNQTAPPELKLKKLASAFKQIDFYDDDEVRRVAETFAPNLVEGVKKMNHKDAKDIHVLMMLCHMMTDFFGCEFENLELEVLDEMACEVAVVIDPRQYDVFRWHQSIDHHTDYIEDRNKMVTHAAAHFLRPRLDALMQEVVDNTSTMPSEDQMAQITDYFIKYECMRAGWEQSEHKTTRFMNATTFLVRLMRTEHLGMHPRYVIHQLGQQIKWIIKMLGFEWTQRNYETFLLTFTFASIQLYAELDKHDDLAAVDNEALDQWTTVLERGIEYLDLMEGGKEERWLTDEEMLKCLQIIDKGLFHIGDYLLECDRRDVRVPLDTMAVLLRCYSKFTRHGNVVQLEKKYGPRLTELFYRMGRELLAAPNDESCQTIVHAVEILLVNATSLSELPTELCLLLADYLKFDYDEGLKGIDIDREGTFYAGRELLKREDWYTPEGLQLAIDAAQEKVKARSSMLQTQHTRALLEELKKKRDSLNSPPATQE
ncbi:unnamed protein product, partial [Mesorhabditis spiculigera]